MRVAVFAWASEYFILDVMENTGLTLNTPNQGNMARRGSALSMAHEMEMNQLAGKLYGFSYFFNK